MMRLALIVGLALLQGCAVQAASYAVHAYCVVPGPVRQANRILINVKTYPDRVAITCADGVPHE